MRFLLRLTSEGSPKEGFLASVRSFARSVGVEARNPKWTSYGALEVDIFARAKGDYELFLAAISPIYEVEFSRDLNVAPPHHTDERVIEEARGYFDSERYWEAHETLEGLWRVKTGEEKQFLQGLILLCAAFVHHQKGRDDVTSGVLGRAIPRLEFSSPGYHGLDTVSIRAEALRMAKTGDFSPFRLPKHR